MATSNAKSNYLEQKIIEATLKNTSWAGGATIYLALGTAVTTPETGTGGWTEVANLYAYARQSLTAASAWSAGGQVGSGDATAYEVSNAADIAFPAASGGSWGTVTHFAIFDSATIGAGNMYYYGALDASKLVNDGDQFKFLAGNLKINET